MSKEYLAGISVDSTIARIAVLLIKRSGITVHDLIEVERRSDDPFWFLEPFLVKMKPVKKVARVSIALDDSIVFRHTFPLDTSLTSADRIGHVRWELAQVVSGFDPATTLHDLHVLRQDAETQVADALVVAVPRNVITSIRDQLATVQIGLHKVDTRYFGGQYALVTNYPEINSETVCLCAAGEEKIDAGLIENGQVIRYISVSRRDDQEVIAGLSGLAGETKPARFFFWGSPVPTVLMRLVTERFERESHFVDPFLHLKVSRRLRRRSLIAGHEHEFAAAVGCALLK